MHALESSSSMMSKQSSMFPSHTCLSTENVSRTSVKLIPDPSPSVLRRQPIPFLSNMNSSRLSRSPRAVMMPRVPALDRTMRANLRSRSRGAKSPTNMEANRPPSNDRIALEPLRITLFPSSTRPRMAAQCTLKER